MPETQASTGFSATFGIHNGADPGEFVKVAEVTAITPPGSKRDIEEATHLESPDRHKEFIANLAEIGEATITLNFVPSATHELQAAFDAGAGRFQIAYPSGVTLTFSGIVTAFQPGEISNSRMTATFTVKGTGKATWAAGS
jgi:hypothetical protein